MLSLFIFSNVSSTCQAATGTNFKYVISGSTLTVSGRGDMPDTSKEVFQSYAYRIKKIVVKKGVTSISNRAFWRCSNVTSISLPSGLTTIGDYAFYNTKLKKVNLPKSLKSISGLSFYKNLSLKYFTIGGSKNGKGTKYSVKNGVLYSLKKSILYVFPAGRTGSYRVNSRTRKIMDYAFYYSSISKVKLPDKLKYIKNSAFAYSNITSMKLPDTVISLGDAALANCRLLKSLEFGKGIKTASLDLCNGDVRLEKVNLGQVVTIKPRAFKNCTSLSSISVPNTTTLIDQNAFDSTCHLNNLSNTSLVKDDGIYESLGQIHIAGTKYYNYAFDVVTKVNEERKAHGLSSLQMDKDLMEAAMTRAYELVLYFSHERPTGRNSYTACYAKSNGAENIALGQSSPASVMSSWMNSPGHRSNILNGSSSSIGVGCVYINGNYYWVQIFGGKNINRAYKSSYTNKTVTQAVLIKKTAKYGSSYGIIAGKMAEIPAGTSSRLQIAVSNGYIRTPLLLSDFTFKSSDPTIASVDPNGVVQGGRKGTVTVTATLKNYSQIKVTFSITII